MFYLNKDIELTPDLLSKMLDKFAMVSAHMTNYKKYYDGLQDILKKQYADPSKPCNRTVTNYCKNIADSYCGYLAAPGFISYSSDQDIEDIMDVLRYNDYQDQDADFLLDALVYGTAAELMYIDAESQTRFKLIDPTSCFGVYDDSLSGDLMYFVRIYSVNDWDNSDKHMVDVYSDRDVKHFTMTGMNGQLVLIGEEPHYFSQCPANIFYLPDEKSIFDCVMGLQDTANELLSGEVDDFAAFCDAYLVITGAELDPEKARDMRANRILQLPPNSNGAPVEVSWLTKQVNDAQIENMLKRVQENIYRIAACPDFSSDSFTGGVASGISIQYKLTGMETRAAKIEAVMKKALQRRIEIICGVASMLRGEEIFRDIKITFKRNIPEDSTAKANEISSYRGFVSDATLLGQIDFIQDVNAEMEQIQKEKAEAASSLYNFGLPTTIDEEEEEVV